MKGLRPKRFELAFESIFENDLTFACGVIGVRHSKMDPLWTILRPPQVRREQPSVRRKTFLTDRPVDDRLISDVSWVSPEVPTLEGNGKRL